MSPHLLALTPLPPTWQWSAKWLFLATAALAVGAAITYLAVLRPATAHPEEAESLTGLESPAGTTLTLAQTRERVLTAMSRVVTVSSWLFVAGWLLSTFASIAKSRKTDLGAVLQADALGGYLTAAPAHGAWWAPGQVALAQVVLIVLAAVLATVAMVRGPQSHRGGGGLLGTASILLILSVLVSILPTGPADNTADGWVGRLSAQTHILASSAWVGGLVALVVLTRSRLHLRDAVVDVWIAIWHRFSVVAMVSVGVLTLSGAWLAFSHIGAVEQLFTTTYGLVLTVKLVLVALLLGAGALNQFVLMPRLVSARRAGDTRSAMTIAVSRFGAVVLTESVIGIVVLVLASMLSGSARQQAGTPTVGPVGPMLLVWGLGLLAVLVGSLWATARASDAIARRPHTWSGAAGEAVAGGAAPARERV